MAEIVSAFAGKVSEFFVAPIGRRLGYLFCYRSHVEKLRNEVQTLRAERNDEQITVDEATRQGDEIRPVVREWLNRVDRNTGEADALMTDDQNMSCLNGWCPNLISRYQLGREAYKKAQVIVGIQTARNFPDGISYRVPPQMAPVEGYECFQSRDSTLNDIMDALRDDKTKMIGVCGMGGVGKTMLVKQAAQQAKQQNLFTTYIFIDVSWTRDSKKDEEEGIVKIQQKTADMLGFQFKGKDESTRADELKQRLQKKKEPEKENQQEKEKEQKKENILIILDDIWREINLEKVGIPFKDDQTICKLVLVSRDIDLLRKEMGAQKYFQIQHLQREEAWCLLKKIAGDSVEGDQLQPTAIKVLDECGGLPIAIVTIATALKDETVAVWKNALDELRSCAPTNIRGMEKKVYSCLEWSYNHLKGDEVKSLFLLCGCLSYYGDISMDQMLRYATGLNFFDRICSLEGAINKLVTLVKTLKASSLLLDGAEDDGAGSGVGASRLLFMDGDHKSVRMHDLVRDVARIIASKDPHRFKVVEDDPSDQDWIEIENESKFISLYCKAMDELPPRLVCPKLQFFISQSNNGAFLNTIPNTFFEGMSQLKILALSGMYFPTLPSTLQSLANLRTLCLDRCKLGDVAIIGELKKLQVLSMVGSDIQQLPREMMQLTNLRLLDLNYCRKLKVIPRDILSSLSRLECLFMKSSFSEWAAEEVCDGESNACLLELNNLHRLRTIEVKIPNAELVPNVDMFNHNLTSYAIIIGNFDRLPETYEESKTLFLEGYDGSLLYRDGIRKLLRSTEKLKLWGLEVCGGPIPVRSFDNLKTLVVRNCHGLKILFLLSMGRDLPQLEETTIKECNEMQQIMEDGHVGFNLQLVFPKLRSLKLGYLPKLVKFGYFRSEMETTSEAMCSQGNPDINMPFFNYQVCSSLIHC